MGTLRFFEEVVSFKIRRTFGFADYKPEGKRADPRGRRNFDEEGEKSLVP